MKGDFVGLAEANQGVPNAIVSGTFHGRGILRRIAPQRCEKDCVALLERYLHAHHFEGASVLCESVSSTRPPSSMKKCGSDGSPHSGCRRFVAVAST